MVVVVGAVDGDSGGGGGGGWGWGGAKGVGKKWR